MTGQVQRLVVEGFRSICSLEIKFDSLNLITGPNGCGKSNLFNAFQLLKSAVEGNLGNAIAGQGGMESILWAGPQNAGPRRMKIAFVSEPFDYEIELGLRPFSELPLFPMDPQIKKETVKLAGRMMIDRKSSVAHMRGLDGKSQMRSDLVDSESIFAQIRDPERYPYLYLLKQVVENWTFYHDFRTDADSPLRRPAVPTYASSLAPHGANIGPFLRVIFKHGEREEFERIMAQAFPDSTVYPEGGSVQMNLRGIERPMSVNELSDGTLKFIALVAACFAIRPPTLIAFNEPEASLNSNLIGPLADAMAHAAVNSQLWVTTHSQELVKGLVDRMACRPIALSKVDGETVLGGRSQRLGYSEDDEN